MDLWFYPQKYEKFSKKRLSRLLIRCRPAVPLRIAGHPRFRPWRRVAVPFCRVAPPRRSSALPGRTRSGTLRKRPGDRSVWAGWRSGGGTSVSRGFAGFSADRGGVRNPPENLFFGPVLFFFAEKTVSSRRGIVIRRMLLRIQYALFVLLFVLLSAVVPASDGMRVRDEACATLCEQHVVPVPAPARFCFATVCSLPDMAGLPDAAGGSKSPVRIPADVRPSACVAARLSEPRSPCTARRSVSARWITTSSRWGIF